MNNPTVLEIAKQHGKTPAQVLLRHIVQRGIAAIPKSTNPGRIRQNLQVRCNISSNRFMDDYLTVFYHFLFFDCTN
jgi:diketogulonate reductase-like aldo/keto reductase